MASIDARYAITRIQNIRDGVALEQVRWYVEDVMGRATTGDETFDELDAIRASDDWQSYSGYEQCEVEEYYCGQLDAYDNAATVLHLLAVGVTPEQGS
jgi:hypothetical protein